MQRRTLITILLVTALMGRCSTNRDIVLSNNSESYFRIQGGLNKGDILENTDMDVVAGVGVARFSGATSTALVIYLPVQLNQVN